MSNTYLNFFKREMPLFVAYAKEHYSDILPSSAFNEIEHIMPEVLEVCAEHGNLYGDLGSIFAYFYNSNIWAASVANQLYNLFYWEDNSIRHFYSSPYEVITSKSKGSILFRKFGTIPCKVTRQTAILLALRSVQFRAFTPIEDIEDQWIEIGRDNSKLRHIRETGLFKDKSTGDITYLRANYAHTPNSSYSSWIARSRSGKVELPIDLTSVNHYYYVDGSYTREIDLNHNSYLDFEFFARFKEIVSNGEYTLDECRWAKKIFTLVLCDQTGNNTFTTISADMARYHVSHYGYNAERYLDKIDFTTATDEMGKDTLNSLKPILHREHPSYRKVWDLVGYIFYMIGEREELTVSKDRITVNRRGNNDLGIHLCICETSTAILDSLNGRVVVPRPTGFYMFKAIPRYTDLDKHSDFLYLNADQSTLPKKFLDWNDDVGDAYCIPHRKVVLGGGNDELVNVVDPKPYNSAPALKGLSCNFDDELLGNNPGVDVVLGTVYDTTRANEICYQASVAKAVMDATTCEEHDQECDNDSSDDSSNNSSEYY